MIFYLKPPVVGRESFIFENFEQILSFVALLSPRYERRYRLHCLELASMLSSLELIFYWTNEFPAICMHLETCMCMPDN